MSDFLRRIVAPLAAMLFIAMLQSASAQEAPMPPVAEPTLESPLPADTLSADTVPADMAEDGEGLSEPTVDPGTLPHDLSPIGMFLGADYVVKAVIAGLASASIVTWAIFLTKSIELGAVRRRWTGFRGRIGRAGTLEEAVELSGRRRDAAASLVRAAVDEVELSRGLPAEGIKERALARFDRIQAGAGREMGRGTGVLASVGSLSPFVGLFGTVWGIMNSFIGISQSNTTNLAIVAPGIAEALFATGIGLVAAIPAVLFYNVFARMISGNKAALADVAADTLGLLSRDLDRAASRGSLRLIAAAE